MEFLINSPAVSSAFIRRRTGNGIAGANRRQVSLWRHGLAVLTLFLLGELLGKTWASEFDEYAVKAAYLYNFAKYVEWPPGAFASANAPLLICIAGDDPFGNALAVLSGKTIENHPVETRRLSVTTDLTPCHIVFVGRAE